MSQPPEASLPARVLVDTNFLVAMLTLSANDDIGMRARHLVERLAQRKGTVIVPMPAVAEYLVKADEAGVTSLNTLEHQEHALMAPFDRAAAFECALLDRAAILGGNKDKKDGSDEPWQKIKIDRQIVAIGKVHGAQLVISEDSGVRMAALRSGMQAMTMAQLPLSPEDSQRKLPLPDPKPKTPRTNK